MKNNLTCEERSRQHLLQNVLINYDLICLIVWTPVLRLIPLVDSIHDKCLAVCRLDPKDDAPEKVTLWTSLACLVVIREIGIHLDIRQDVRHQLCN